VKVHSDHLAQLMAAELKPYSSFQDDMNAMAALKRNAAALLGEAQSSGEVRAYMKEGFCCAFVSILKKKPAHFDTVLESLNVHVLPGDEAALAWTQEQLLKLSIDEALLQTLALSGLHVSLLPTLAQRGIGVDAVGLIADTQTSLTQIMQHVSLWESFEKHGLECVPMQVVHVDAIVALRRRTYRDLPEYCWFGAQESHLLQYGQRMKAAAKSEHLWWVLLDKGGVVGNFGGEMVLEDPLWGPRSSVEVLFAPQYRGKRLMKTAYRWMLEGLSEKKIPTYLGTTAQMPVMKLGRLTGRQMFRIQLHSRAEFEKEHFQIYLP